MRKIDELIKVIAENELEPHLYFKKDGSCACAIGYAFKIAGVDNSRFLTGKDVDKGIFLDINKQCIEAVEINGKSAIEKLEETFPEFVGSWVKVQGMNDSGEKFELIEYLKKNIQESDLISKED